MKDDVHGVCPCFTISAAPSTKPSVKLGVLAKSWKAAYAGGDNTQLIAYVSTKLAAIDSEKSQINTIISNLESLNSQLASISDSTSYSTIASTLNPTLLRLGIDTSSFNTVSDAKTAIAMKTLELQNELKNVDIEKEALNDLIEESYNKTSLIQKYNAITGENVDISSLEGTKASIPGALSMLDMFGNNNGILEDTELAMASGILNTIPNLDINDIVRKSGMEAETYIIEYLDNLIVVKQKKDIIEVIQY